MIELRVDAFKHWVESSTRFRDVRLGPALSGGNSNVTRLVETAQGPLVVRHPPTNLISDKASGGIAREFAALTALYGKAPVAEPIAWCDDCSILGQPFSLTRFVDGIAITDRLPDAYLHGVDKVSALGVAMVSALGQVHRVDPQALVTQKFGRPDGFIIRQIDRWVTVRERESVRPLPLLDDVASWLRANCPAPAAARIVHCDFHLDNCLASPGQPKIEAILDWEMATIADPRIDLGLALFFWNRKSERRLGFPAIQAVSNHDGVIDRRALADVWARISGVEPDDLSYFMTFMAWRLAAIVEGAYVLCRRGKVQTAYARHLEHDVPTLLEEAAAIINDGAVR